MNQKEDGSKHLIESLNERQKELNCIHTVENILMDYDSPIEDVLNKIHA